MEEHPQDDLPAQSTRSSDSGRSHGSGLVFLLVALALILAIGFFYFSKQRADGQADHLTNAARQIDDTTTVFGDAARNAADALRGDNAARPN